MQRLVVGVLGLVLLLAALLLANTWRQGSRQQPVEPLPPLALDVDAAAASLAAAVRAKTVSGLLDPAAAGVEFEALHTHLRARYRLLHVELVGVLRPRRAGGARGLRWQPGRPDARHFEAVADDVYRFTPVRAGPADLQRFHGTDERLSVANLAEMIRFYHRLLRLAAL